jgi:hypothetical protein
MTHILITPEHDQKMMEYLDKIRKANYDGYVGCLPNGNLVDRREKPEAYPVAESSMFGISKPRCIKCEQVTHISKLLDSLCPECRKQKVA